MCMLVHIPTNLLACSAFQYHIIIFISITLPRRLTTLSTLKAKVELGAGICLPDVVRTSSHESGQQGKLVDRILFGPAQVDSARSCVSNYDTLSLTYSLIRSVGPALTHNRHDYDLHIPTTTCHRIRDMQQVSCCCVHSRFLSRYAAH
jgi:hypothetical protein